MHFVIALARSRWRLLVLTSTPCRDLFSSLSLVTNLIRTRGDACPARGITCFRSLFEEMVPVCRVGVEESLVSDAMRGKFISSKVALPRETGTINRGKSLTAKALISQPEEDTDGAGPAPEGGDAVGIGGDRGDP